MRETWIGSGIYSRDVAYGYFYCENEECEKLNEDGDTATDDLGNYSIECEFCGCTYLQSSLKEDRDNYYADMDDER